MEEFQHDFLEWDWLPVVAVFLDVLTCQSFHFHHFQHHGEVEVDIEEILFPLDADDSGGVELEILYFYGFHFSKCFMAAKLQNNPQWAIKCTIIVSDKIKFHNFVPIYKQKSMRKNLIITAFVMLFASMSFAQTIETVDVSKAPDGKFTVTASDCIIEGQVLKGQKVGTWIEYFTGDNYLPRKIVSFANGKKNGAYVEIDKTGSITKKADYKDDQLDGQCSQWYRGGRLSKMNTYKNGLMDGRQVICYDKGGLQEESNYKDGQRNGLTTWYNEDGAVKMSIEYKDGKFDGVQKTYYQNGQLKSCKSYKANKQHGDAKEYYENGALKSEATYKEGKLSGKEKTYENKGGKPAEKQTAKSAKKN